MVRHQAAPAGRDEQARDWTIWRPTRHKSLLVLSLLLLLAWIAFLATMIRWG